MSDFFEKRSVTCKPTFQNNFRIDDEDSEDENIDLNKPILLQEHTFVKKSKISFPQPVTNNTGFFVNRSNSVQLGCLSFGSLKRPKIAFSQKKNINSTQETHYTSDNDDKKKDKKRLFQITYPKLRRTKSESHAIEKEIIRDLQCKIFQTLDITSKYKGTVYKKSTFLTLKPVTEDSDNEDNDDENKFLTKATKKKPLLTFGFSKQKKLNFKRKK
jgi:hypothetical protein